MPLYWGSTAVMTRAAQTGASVLSLVEDQNVTRVITVPAVIRELVAAAKQSTEARRQMSTVTVLCCASEKLPPSLCDEFFDLFELEILDAIGSAEVTYQWIANRPADYKRASLGKPIFGYDIKLLDENGAAISTPHTQGEAWIKSETGLLFYWRDFQKTREATNGLWFKTGDKLMFDEDGFYWFVGRGDDLFKIAGLWVSPIEVEAEIAKHPSVAECAVVAGENDQGKTFVRAFVVPRDDAVSRSSLEEEIRSAVKQIGGYKVPKQIEFVSELPRTELRKINRRLLREM
jgi:benzoate-CoA ligase